MIKDKERILWQKIEEYGNIQNNDVLDIGCGEGTITKIVAESAKTVFGIDQDIDLIQIANQNYNFSNLKFQKGFAQSLDFGNGSFDSILYIESLHHVPINQQKKALEEAYRVLRPKGILLIIEPVYKEGRYEEIVSIYNDERKTRENTKKVINQLIQTLFTLETEQSFKLIYVCRDFKDFYLSEIQPKPWIKWKDSYKPRIEQSLKQCDKNGEGNYILDYKLSMWVLRKKIA